MDDISKLAMALDEAQNDLNAAQADVVTYKKLNESLVIKLDEATKLVDELTKKNTALDNMLQEHRQQGMKPRPADIDRG